MTRTDAVQFLLERPYKLGHLVGFTKLTELHNGWIKIMVRGREDYTLQAHRGSYKTTCVSIALAIIIVLLPNKTTLFMRKTDDDTKEIVRQVKNILESERMQVLVKAIYGKPLAFTIDQQNQLSTNLTTNTKGTSQLMAMGIGSSLTGKHFDFIFTDDIVNIEDRTSRAARERTKLIYQELQNILNNDAHCRIFNSGTPWHPDDCFTLMPNIHRHDCYETGILTADDIAEKKQKMTASLFAANYELKHIANEKVLFPNPITGGDPSMVEQGICHIDAAYGGEDFTAFTICRKYDGKYWVFAKLWQKHVDDCIDEIIRLRQAFNAGRIYCETNGDKGYLAKALRARGERTAPYPEKQNKFLKITSYLKGEWQNVVFVTGSDDEYIKQVSEYNEDAEHDDAPDSLASMIRILWAKKGDDQRYQSLWG